MSKVIDLTGQKFNHWTVLERAKNNHKGQAMWKCQCDCEERTIKEVESYSLRSGASKSCGCLQRKKASETNFKDIKGQKFGHLTVLELAGKDKHRKLLWKCQCDCEAQTIITTRGVDLRSGKTFSCGCISSKGEEIIAKILTENNIPFEKEKTFSNCKFSDTQAYARFDFYVNNSYLIEYDGIQHFEPTFNYFGSELFNNTIKHDEFKTQWCKENNIPLIRISYKDLNKITIKDLII